MGEGPAPVAGPLLLDQRFAALSPLFARRAVIRRHFDALHWQSLIVLTTFWRDHSGSLSPGSMNDLFDKSRRAGARISEARAANDRRVISIRGAREHNLKNVDVEFPRDQLIVFTGLSGSGKSSLAFDTIYAEGQRRYVESLSAYARQFLEMMQKPDVDQIDGLSPAISIEIGRAHV